MPNAKNQEMLANVKADLEATSAVWVVDYCGLTVKQILGVEPRSKKRKRPPPSQDSRGRQSSTLR